MCVNSKKEHKALGGFFAAFNRWFERITQHYVGGVTWMIRRGAIAALLFIGDGGGDGRLMEKHPK
jgi:multidrug efflux pump